MMDSKYNELTSIAAMMLKLKLALHLSKFVQPVLAYQREKIRLLIFFCVDTYTTRVESELTSIARLRDLWDCIGRGYTGFGRSL